MPGSVSRLGLVGGLTKLISASFTRPADTIQYTANDAVSNSTSAPVAIKFASAARTDSKSGLIVSARLEKNATTTTNASFRLWLFRSALAATSDNAAFQIAHADRLNRIGYIDFTSFVAGSDCAEAIGSVNPTQILFADPGDESNLYGILQATAAYTPASGEVFIVELGILQD